MPNKEPRFLVFEKLTKEQVDDLMLIKTASSARQLLAELLDPYKTAEKFALEGDQKIDEKAEIVLDFHVNNYEFTLLNNFNAQKTDTFLEMMDHIFIKCMADRLPKDKAMVLFKTYCLRHSVQRPPHSLFIFNLNEVKEMTHFVQYGFLKFYSMYQYAIISKLELEMEHHKLFL